MLLEGKTVLVTGGTGSLGRTFVHRALSGKHGAPRKVIVFSRDEAKQHQMRLDYLHKKVATDEVIYRNFSNVLEFRIGDVRSYADVCAALRGADIVINAAAMKQVPTCEYFPVQAIETNCMGPWNIVRAIQEHTYPVETVLTVSTDKACKPVNAMGMTKALQERILVSANILHPAVRFIGVRYGNVLASRGSVIPLFHEQIRQGGPVTITSVEMTRFLLSLDQAVDTVLIALREARPGEIYVPYAAAATVADIAKALIGTRNIKTVVTGVRPGEKIHEIMVSEEEANHCVKRGDYYAIRPMLPELSGPSAEPNGLEGEFSSKDNVLDYEGTVDLLRRNDLLVETSAAANAGKILQ